MNVVVVVANLYLYTENRVSMLRKLGNICCGYKLLLNKIRNIFCVLDIKFVGPQRMLRARANGETFVSATMCPQQCVLVCQGRT